MEVQEKILRVVEYGTFERVGSSESIDVDVRIIAATNADLIALADEGRFMRDLLDRISFEVLFLPPLRERQGDIALLANHFAGRMALELGRKEMPQFSPEAMDALEGHDWPGNVRELKNLVERAVYRSDSPLITHIDFDPFRVKTLARKEQKPEDQPARKKADSLDDLMGKPLDQAVRELQIRFLKRALKEARFNQKQAARILGLTYHQFRGLYRKYGTELD
jgi:psp operon transcriptional activator